MWPGLLSFLLLFCVVALPLITTRKAMDISLIPRLLALYLFLIALTLVFSFKKVFKGADFSVLRIPVFPTYAAYLLVCIVSLGFAVNPSAGLFDVFKTFAVLLLMAYSCFLFLKNPGWRQLLAKYSIIASIVIISIGLAEMIRDLGFGFHPRGQMSTVKGLMSNVNLYASSLMLLIPWSLFGIVALRRWWRVVAGVSLGLLVFMIFLLQTRAAYVGLLGSALVVAGMILIHHKAFSFDRKWRNRVGIGIFVGLAVFATLVVTAGDDNIYANRFRSIFSTDANEARVRMWHLTAKLFTDHPLTGVGAGNFTIRVQENYGAYDFTNTSTNYLRPHNDFLWIAAEKGIAGILLFLLFVSIPMVYAWKIIRGDSEKEQKWLALFAMMGLSSYLLNSLFDFPLERINHQVHLAFFVSVIATLWHQRNPAEQKAFPVQRAVVVIPVLVVLATGLYYNLEAMKQEEQVIEARKAWVGRNWEVMLEASRAAATPWKTLDQLATPVVFMEGLALSMLDRIPEATEKMELARKHNPHRQYILYNLGNLYIKSQEYDKAIESFSAVLHMYPQHTEALTNLAACYINIRDYGKAVEILESIPEEKRTDKQRHNLRYVKQLMEQEGNNTPANSGNQGG